MGSDRNHQHQRSTILLAETRNPKDMRFVTHAYVSHEV